MYVAMHESGRLFGKVMVVTILAVGRDTIRSYMQSAAIQFLQSAAMRAVVNAALETTVHVQSQCLWFAALTAVSATKEEPST